MKYYDENRSPLIITEKMHSIAVSANWFGGWMVLELKRNGRDVTQQWPFGHFDSSMNQTDRVFTKENCELVEKAQPGDQLYIKKDGGYTLNLRVDMLAEGEEHKPFWSYKCPLGHPLSVFYPEEKYSNYENEEWLQLTRGKKEHLCGHEKKMKSQSGRLLLQYFCFEC